MDLAHFRCPCGETISGETVVDPDWTDAVELHKAACVLARYPDTRPPFYFRRIYEGDTDTDEAILVTRAPDGRILIHASATEADIPAELREKLETVSLVPDGLVIYGRAIWPEDEHDRQVILSIYQPRGQVFSQCFSERCVDGEVGTHPLAALSEISREEFLKAQTEGWR